MFTFVIPSIFSIGNMVFKIMLQVAPLAQCSKVFKIIICFIMVNVCHGKHYTASGNWVRFIVFSKAPFTFIFSTGKPDQPAYQCPLWMIFFVIYWHINLKKSPAFSHPEGATKFNFFRWLSPGQ